MSGHIEATSAMDAVDATVTRGGQMAEKAEAHGRYEFTCYGPDGAVKWAEIIDNVVCTIGKNLALTSFLAGSAYTVTGPFMGLISSVSFSAVAVTDTMTSHAGWLEAGNANAPTYSGARNTAVWGTASAGAISLTIPLVFAITGTGTVEGAFLAFGTGAVSTIDNTSGTLYSAGVFSGGAKLLGSGDTLNVSYTASLT